MIGTVADAGSTWCKLFEIEHFEKRIIPTAELRDKKPVFNAATGHSAKPYAQYYENELVALAEGTKRITGEKSFTVVDVGSRDIKYVKFDNSKAVGMDWSSGCASSTGATIEMLARFYNLDFNSMPLFDDYINVTCGTFGIEKIMDMVASGENPDTAVSLFIHGLVRNVVNFLSHPDKLFLSGGFCENPAFTGYLARYSEARLLGRFVLIAGLCSILGIDVDENILRERDKLC